jgi:subtilisin family serine protease
VRHRLPALTVTLLAASACADSTAPAGRTTLAPFLEASPSVSTRVVPNEFIVVLKDDAPGDDDAPRRARGRGGQVVAQWRHAIRGFAVRGGPALLAALRSDHDVAWVEPVQEFGIGVAQTPATWGLDRIDQRNLPLNNTYNYTKTGSGVRAYIIDTGILITHSQFGGRASHGFDFVDNDANATDCNGHGTHVAGTVGGSTHGVAKAVSLVAVRVLNCSGSGTTTGVINGVNWVTQNAVRPAVANMSLGGGASSSLDQAVNNSINSGVTYAIAAGNSNRNACFYSPARVAAAITVGATTSSDARASYSNYGSCLDLFAPGSSITSAWYTSTSATAVLSGTSMAAPHVAGAAALYLQGTPSASPSQVRTAIVNAATTGKVTNRGGQSPNRLLHTGTF